MTTQPPSTRAPEPEVQASMLVHEARWLLLGATVFWGLSFPLMRGLQLAQKAAVPSVSDLSLASLDNLVRFGLASLLLSLFYGRTLLSVTRLELSQGLGLAGFAGCGLYLQTLGLSWTDASVTAFLTQFYALLVPIYVAVRDRVRPSLRVVAACLLVMAGTAVLRPGLFRHLTLGPGEGVVLLSTFFLAGQILWVERPRYINNRPGVVTLLMFLGMTLLFGIGHRFLGGVGVPWRPLLGTGPLIGLMAAVIFGCTLFNFLIMNTWQHYVSATEASMIYCLEPVLAAFLSCFLPQFISRLAGIDYPNERLSWSLLIGGLLITSATLLLALAPRRRR